MTEAQTDVCGADFPRIYGYDTQVNNEYNVLSFDMVRWNSGDYFGFAAQMVDAVLTGDTKKDLAVTVLNR